MRECGIASLLPSRLVDTSRLRLTDPGIRQGFSVFVSKKAPALREHFLLSTSNFLLEIIVPIEHVRHEFHNERFVGVIAENRLLHQVDRFLRKLSGRSQFCAALAVLVAEHVQAAWAATVVECTHLRASDKRVAFMPEDDVELLADRFVDHVNVHPSAARKQNNLLTFFLELEPVQVRIHRVRSILELLSHVRVDHTDDAVHQDLHLSRNAEQEQRKAPDDNVGVRELFANHRNVVVFDKARTIFAPPATEATATGLDMHPVDKDVLGLVVAVLLQSFDKSLRRDECSTTFIFWTSDHYENFLFFCHARKFRKKVRDELDFIVNRDEMYRLSV